MTRTQTVSAGYLATIDSQQNRPRLNRTNYKIGAGFKPDVLWFRLDPSKHSNAAPIAVFEVEFSSAQSIAKSMASLKHAFDLGTQKLLCIVVRA